MNPFTRIGIGVRNVIKDLFFRIPTFDEVIAAIRPIVGIPSPDPSADAARVAILTVRGLVDFNLFNELVIAKALTLRGHQCRGLICDGTLPACDTRTVLTADPDAVCRECRRRSRVGYQAFGIPAVTLSELVAPETIDRFCAQVEQMTYPDLFDFTADGVALGQIARASTYRYFLRGSLDERHEPVARKFLLAAMIQLEASKGLLEQFAPTHAFSSHGIYVSWGVFAQHLPQQGVRTNYYDASYRRGTIRVTNGADVFKFFIDEPEERWRDLDLTPARVERLENYLASRLSGKNDWPKYRWQPKRPKSAEAAVQLLKLDPSKSKVGLFTNIAWDAVIHYDSDAFTDMFDWVFATIDHFADRPEIELLIGVHPAEIRLEDKTQERLIDALQARYPQMPAHIKLVSPELNISNYTVASLCRAAIVYGTNMGLEMALRGMPVIVAGTPLYHGKGFTLDVATREQYEEILGNIDTLPPPDKQALDRARRYAYHLFFETSLPFNLIEWGPNFEIKGLNFTKAEYLTAGNDTALEMVCDSILRGTPIKVGDDFV